jgi:hypothetical protein
MAVPNYALDNNVQDLVEIRRLEQAIPASINIVIFSRPAVTIPLHPAQALTTTPPSLELRAPSPQQPEISASLLDAAVLTSSSAANEPNAAAAALQIASALSIALNGPATASTTTTSNAQSNTASAALASLQSVAAANVSSANALASSAINALSSLSISASIAEVSLSSEVAMAQQQASFAQSSASQILSLANIIASDAKGTHVAPAVSGYDHYLIEK